MRRVRLALLAAVPFLAATPDLVQSQTPASGMLEVPAKMLSAPSDVSPQLAKIIGAPLRSNWDIHPKTGEEWKPVADAGAAALSKLVPGMMERLKVKVEKTSDRKSTRLNSSHLARSRMPSSA